MIPEHEAAVRASWVELAGRADEVAARFHERLVALDPEARALFGGRDLEAHRQELTRVLQELADSLEAPERMVGMLVALGRRHHGYGVREDQITPAGDVLVEALRETLDEAFTAEVEEAWRELVELMGAVMRRAVRGGCRAPP